MTISPKQSRISALNEGRHLPCENDVQNDNFSLVGKISYPQFYFHPDRTSFGCHLVVICTVRMTSEQM